MGGLDQALSSHFRTSKDGKTGGNAREQTSQMVADCFSPPTNPGFDMYHPTIYAVEEEGVSSQKAKPANSTRPPALRSIDGATQRSTT